MKLELAIVGAMVGCVACTTTDRAPARLAFGAAVAPLDRAVTVYDTAARHEVTLDELWDDLARRDVVFLGETHLDDTTHRFEVAALAALIERTGGRVVLSMEMFERDVQPVLDAYVGGAIDEADFLARSRPWGNYVTGYRPLIELARAHRLPVVAANTPADLRRKIAAGGAEAWQAMSPDERRLMPDELIVTSAEYWRDVDAATRGHLNPSGDATPQDRIYSTQSLWDNCMGDACAQALSRHPDHVVLHVVGAFHVGHRRGTVEQLLARAPATDAVVVTVSPLLDPTVARPERAGDRADYLVHAAATARGPQSGLLAVTMPFELRYSVDVPPHAEYALPLLVWLHDDAVRGEDAQERWRAALGEAAIVCVVRAPFPQACPDLAMGGVWWQPSTFREDLGRLANGLERLVEYVVRRFRVDPERIVVAGRGAGATGVLWTAMGTEWLETRFVSVDPAEPERFAREPLPTSPSVAGPIEVIAFEPPFDAIDAVVADFSQVGQQVRRNPDAIPAPARRRFVERAVREALGLAPEVAPAPDAELWLLVTSAGGARAEQWAELHGRAVENGGREAKVVRPERLEAAIAEAGSRRIRVQPLAFDGVTLPVGEADVDSRPGWTPDRVAAAVALPEPPGAFGGTTVLVVPEVADDATADAWRRLEVDEVLRARNRFARLVVAFGDREPSLATALGEIREAGRRNVLVVPAVFCADATAMQELQRSAGATDGLDIAWLPGLGFEALRLWRD